MEKKYDFILFENLFSVENHYKDLELLALLLVKCGFSIAIADAYKESKLCNTYKLEHLSVPVKAPISFKSLELYRNQKTRLAKFYLFFKKNLYLKRVLAYLEGYTDNIYIGSLTMDFPIRFFKFLNPSINYYVWGLRSATLVSWKYDRSFYYRHLSKSIYEGIKKNINVKIIVSNELIKEEFVNNVGVEDSRIIYRPERFIFNKNINTKDTMGGREINLLTIGTLRPFKHVEFCLDALKEINDPNIHYVIAGRCRDNNGYEELLQSRMIGVPNIKRINKYIPDDEYKQLMNGCDFLVLCDGQQESCASNGTMMEAFLNGKPIIAPDFNPFKYEVERFGIGLLYKYGDVDSLKEAIRRAKELGSGFFYNNLSSYQDQFLIENVAKSIKRQLCAVL